MGAKTTKYSSKDVQSSFHQPSPYGLTTTSTAFDIESGTHPTQPEDLAPLGGTAVVLLMMLFMMVVFADHHEDDPRFSIESASVSLFNISTSHHFDSQWNISFSISNPSNQTTLFCDNLEVSVLYKKELLSVTILEPFYQEKNDNSSVKASFSSSPSIFGDWIASAMARDMTLFRAMYFDVGLRSRISSNPGEKFETNHWVTASCKDVKIDFTSTTTTKVGVMSGGLRNCSVTVE